MKLQVLVNHYQEGEDIVRRFLSSLSIQRGVDFSVLVYSDGGDGIDPSIFDDYGLDLTYRRLPHSGVCHTRNMLMDAADAEYVMFADIDDCLCSDDGLLSLMAVADDTGADIVGSPYLAETYEDGFGYSTYGRDTIHVHGKVFRKAYLEENGIRFPDELETSGDMMFLWLAFMLTEKVAWVQNCSYIWKYNPDSVTRRDEHGVVRNYPRTLKCYRLLGEELKRRGDGTLFDKLVAAIVPMMYLDSSGSSWGNAPSEMRRDAEKAIAVTLECVYDRYVELDDKAKELGYRIELSVKPCESPKTRDGIEPWADGVLSSIRKRDVLIVGNGVVGSNLALELSALEPDMYDKYKGEDGRNLGGYEVAFICVDTPRTEDSACDVSEVRNAIMENDADLYVVKSTVLPGTTEMLMSETGKRIVFSPEYYGATQHCNNHDYEFTILGGAKGDCARVVQLLQRVYDGRHEFRITDARTAELAKYMENAWLAAKVSFCCQFCDIADSIGVAYEELRELFILDPRVNPSHTFVYRDHPYWESHCLDKDVRAVGDEFDAPLIKAIVAFNEAKKEAV